jgi:hypothetical protein
VEVRARVREVLELVAEQTAIFFSFLANAPFRRSRRLFGCFSSPPRRRRATFTKWFSCVMATGLTGSTRAPNARINCDFSAAASSGRDRNASQPSAFATIATETPVEPAVPSVTTPPFLNVPFS